ncbi:hypothetical protein FD754_009752 [Muntiacus muntjak]|uniref:Uncharacterized protein n=1 Tax=Muntiacus muntjak TaxID=9888 RepID=A0A5N3WZF3_MUNMU|nr:hypothetical protein FD754_009752 [Muntiacus muntjak]
MVAQEPALASNFRKEESLFGSCYRKEKAEGKGCAASGSAVDEDRFSLSSAPLGFKDLRPPRPVHSTSPCGHNYSPAPWPLRPTAAEEMCVQMEVQVKALVHSPDPGCDLRQADPARPELPDPLGSPVSPAGGLRLGLGEHAPVVLGLLAQDLIRSTVPMDGSSPVEPGGGLLMGPMGVVLQSLRGSGWHAHTPRLPPLHSDLSRRNFAGLAAQAPTWLRARLALGAHDTLGGKLGNVPDRSFLLRESSDGRSLLSKSLRSHRRTLHTRMEHSNGRLSLDEQLGRGGTRSTVDLMERSIGASENRAFWRSGSRLPGSATHPVPLTNPGSRFPQLRPLQGLRCFHPPVPPDRPDPEAALSNEMKHYLQKHP